MRKMSEKIYQELCKVIPGGVNSPARAFLSMQISPLVAKSGKGAILVDADDNHYIDYCHSWGALILGHADEGVNKAVREQLERGSSFGVTTELEGILANKIKTHMPHLEKIRFVSSGTEATMSALRLARGFSGKRYIVKFIGNYHGHSDQLLVAAGSSLFQDKQASSSLGVSEEMVAYTLTLPFNDREALFQLFQDNRFKGDIAAVIIEPIAGNMGVVPATFAFMNDLRNLCTQHNTLLIFDEVITGFRISLQGAAAYYNIEPDLTCLGKIIGGGFPAAAFGGKEEIMAFLAPQGKVFQAGTLSGNPIAMSAGIAMLTKLEEENSYAQLQNAADLLLDPIRAFFASEGGGCVQSMGSMFTIFFGPKEVSSLPKGLDLDRFQAFFIHMLRQGIYWPQSPYEAAFLSLSHTEAHLVSTTAAILSFLEQEVPASV